MLAKGELPYTRKVYIKWTSKNDWFLELAALLALGYISWYGWKLPGKGSCSATFDESGAPDIYQSMPQYSSRPRTGKVDNVPQVRPDWSEKSDFANSIAKYPDVVLIGQLDFAVGSFMDTELSLFAIFQEQGSALIACAENLEIGWKTYAKVDTECIKKAVKDASGPLKGIHSEVTLLRSDVHIVVEETRGRAQNLRVIIQFYIWSFEYGDICIHYCDVIKGCDGVSNHQLHHC